MTSLFDMQPVTFITGSPNGPVLFCMLTSVVVVICDAAGVWAGRPPGA